MQAAAGTGLFKPPEVPHSAPTAPTTPTAGAEGSTARGRARWPRGRGGALVGSQGYPPPPVAIPLPGSAGAIPQFMQLHMDVKWSD